MAARGARPLMCDAMHVNQAATTATSTHNTPLLLHPSSLAPRSWLIRIPFHSWMCGVYNIQSESRQHHFVGDDPSHTPFPLRTSTVVIRSVVGKECPGHGPLAWCPRGAGHGWRTGGGAGSRRGAARRGAHKSECCGGCRAWFVRHAVATSHGASKGPFIDKHSHKQ